MFSSNGVFLERLHLRSHQCFLDTGKMEFREGINVIAGANNAGKTALLEAAGYREPGGRRHASPETTPDPGGRPQEPCVRHYTLSVGSAVWKQLEHNAFFLALAGDNPQAALGAAAVQCQSQMQQPTLSVRVSLDEAGAEVHPYGQPFQWGQVHVLPGLQVNPGGLASGPAVAGTLGTTLLAIYQSRSFMFKAERYRVGRFPHGDSEVLDPNAANLPEVFSRLQANPERFRRFNLLLNRVLRTVARVSVRPVGADNEIRVWKGDTASERLDLTTPLNECGSGLGQVLAILYVVVESPFPRTILIDEPNTFLHPGAVAALLEIFQEHKQHQYIITTHSPGVISSSRPSTLHLLESEGFETKVRHLSPSEIEHQRAVLTSVGARLEDVFGPDRILWVEGPSEADVYPDIARAFEIPMSRVAVRPLVNASDFDGKHAPLVARIYQSMADGVALIPPACGFLLDREKRTEEQLARISSAAPGRLVFTGRRMLENYFLDRRALHHLLERMGVQIDADAVSDWWQRRAGGRDFEASLESGLPDWCAKVHGAKLLAAAVSELTDTRFTYDKVFAAPILTEWTIANAKEQFEDLAEKIRRLVGS